MALAALFASHTPLMHYRAPAPGVREAVEACFAEVKQWVDDFDPELVVAIGPDHFNGFFYRMMPAFCVGGAASSVGDWKTPTGELPCDPQLAEACVRSLHADGVDAALSHRMDVDHGITQLLDALFEWERLPTVLPVFVNCAAPPLPPLPRVAALGASLGSFLVSGGRRVLVTASGGLSHDPPIPRLADAPPPVRERLVAGGTLDPEARAARQERVLSDAAAQAEGTSPQRPLNPAWDESFLEALCDGDGARVLAMDDEAITRDAGCGGHEIRTWIAAGAAGRTAGIETFERRFYRAVPEWVAGFGVMTGGPA